MECEGLGLPRGGAEWSLHDDAQWVAPLQPVLCFLCNQPEVSSDELSAAILGVRHASHYIAEGVGQAEECLGRARNKSQLPPRPSVGTIQLEEDCTGVGWFPFLQPQNAG